MPDPPDRSIRAAGSKDQAFVEQALQDALTIHVADRVDVLVGGWLVTLLAGYN